MKRANDRFAWKIIPALLLGLLFLAACNKSEEITTTDLSPKITLDSESHVYVTKIGTTFTVTPEVTNADGATFSWKLGGDIVGRGKTLSWSFDQAGSYYFTLRVESQHGADEVSFRVDVSALAPPVISLAAPPTGLEVLKNEKYVFTPDIQNADENKITWYIDGEKVGNGASYTFRQAETGAYTLKVTAENEDGTDQRQIEVEVVDGLTLKVVLPAPSTAADPLAKTVSLGRTIYLRPWVYNATAPEYSWYVDGVLQEGQNDRMFAFTPAAEGSYEVKFVVTDTPTADRNARISRNITRTGNRTADVTLTVECFGEESTLIRNTTGQADFDRVYEFLPAPGQFVNERQTAGYGTESTFEEARTYAQKRLEENKFLSLGGFGGYVIVGFDHSIRNLGGHEGYDFSITGNQFAESSEPGVVWVMQDVNGNGLPDDTWYELRGSETGKDETIQEYAVTYYRPAGKGMNVQWTDNYGSSGQISYLGSFHHQDYYYPLWVAADSYTLYGTCLAGKTTVSGGKWHNGSYDWGYADNAGSDRLSDDPNEEANPVKTYFKIANAMNLDGSDADLQFIDFIKVQTGVNGSADILGEVSTEVFAFKDENL